MFRYTFYIQMYFTYPSRVKEETSIRANQQVVEIAEVSMILPG